MTLENLWIQCAVCCGKNYNKPMTGKITIMRHGRTDMNENLIVGSIDDPLSFRGYQQAMLAGGKFLKEKITFDVIKTSPLVRAVLTALAIYSLSSRLTTDFVYDERIRERCVGEFEGKPVFSEMLKLFMHEEMPAMGSESLTAFRNRIQSFLSEIDATKKTLVVCHALVLMEIQRQIKGCALDTILARGLPGNCEPVTFALGAKCSSCGSRCYEAVSIENF